jgi:hypothetical protein
MLPLDAPVHKVLAVVERNIVGDFAFLGASSLDTLRRRELPVGVRLDMPWIAVSELCQRRNADCSVCRRITWANPVDDQAVTQ